MKYIELCLFLPLVITTLLLGLIFPFKKLRLSEGRTKFIFSFNATVTLLVTFVAIIIGCKKEAIVFNLVSLKFDSLNLMIYFFSALLLSLVIKFSFKYLHKEIGFNKLFLNLSLFWLGQFLFIFSNDHLVLFAGWEFIGVSSIFLISFYDYRKSPILSSLYVMSFYKFADIILIVSLLLLRHSELLQIHTDYLPFVYVGIVIAGLIKSASFPFTSWLPRSMEGPTTTSAIFYVALSVNVGVILILKFLPEIAKVEAASNVLLVSGLLTVLYSSMLARVQVDAKRSLGYSSSIQIGFVLIEMALGFESLALVHLCLNSFYKLYQFMKSPSSLNSYHSMVGENRELFKKTGSLYTLICPIGVRKRLYYYSLNGFYIDNFYLKVSEVLSRFSIIAEQLFYPIINRTKKHTFKTMFWFLYYIIAVTSLSLNAIEINNHYFYTIPFVILLVSFSLLFEKNVNAFVAIFMIYKILESVVVHGVHSHVPYKWIAIFVLGVFILLILMYEINGFKSKNTKFISGVLLIFLMLYFTNFPFLLQSLVNEHIIEEFLKQDNIIGLVSYCLANTFLNIGIYNFIFNKVYLKETIDA